MDVPFHWRLFQKRYRLPPPAAAATSARLLQEIVEAFANVPFENATQINRLHEEGPKPQSADLLITQHLIHGTGGICYALVNALFELLRFYGFEPSFHHGLVGEYSSSGNQRNHAALTVPVEGRTFLVDPGMLFRAPLILEDGVTRVVSGIRESDLLVEKNALGHLLVMLRSARGFGHTFMIDLRPVRRDEFLRAWNASFDPLLPADYLLVHKVIDGTLWMIQDHRLLSRDASGRTVEHASTWHDIADRFGIDAPILERAWRRTRYATVRHRVRQEIVRAARTTMSLVRTMEKAVKEAAEKRAA